MPLRTGGARSSAEGLVRGGVYRHEGPRLVAAGDIDLLKNALGALSEVTDGPGELRLETRLEAAERL